MITVNSFLSVLVFFISLVSMSDQGLLIEQNSTNLHFTNILENSAYGSLDKINITFFDDMNCQSCSSFFDKAMSEFSQLSDQEVDIQFKLFLRPDLENDSAKTVVKNIFCAQEQGQFNSFYTLYNQSRYDLDSIDFSALIKDFEMNKDQFSACLNSDEVIQKIQKESDLASEISQNIFPSVRLNQYLMTAEPPVENIKFYIQKLKKKILTSNQNAS